MCPCKVRVPIKCDTFKRIKKKRFLGAIWYEKAFSHLGRLDGLLADELVRLVIAVEAQGVYPHGRPVAVRPRPVELLRGRAEWVLAVGLFQLLEDVHDTHAVTPTRLVEILA
jgi:hypothetical protein